MDRKLSLTGAALNIAGVLVFAAGMLTGPFALCCIASIFIAWGLTMMNGGFWRYGRRDAKVAAACALVFGGMYAFCNTMVYFIQISTVANNVLGAQAAKLLDYRRFGMMFDIDMLGYCLMAISTFFAGLTIEAKDRGGRWLKALLILHGVFAPMCFIMPMLGLFSAGMAGADWIGTAILEFWCAYFLPIGILSFRYFYIQGKESAAVERV